MFRESSETGNDLLSGGWEDLDVWIAEINRLVSLFVSGNSWLRRWINVLMCRRTLFLRRSESDTLMRESGDFFVGRCALAGITGRLVVFIIELEIWERRGKSFNGLK